VVFFAHCKINIVPGEECINTELFICSGIYFRYRFDILNITFLKFPQNKATVTSSFKKGDMEVRDN
jgi:hypothetical protein